MNFYDKTSNKVQQKHTKVNRENPDFSVRKNLIGMNIANNTPFNTIYSLALGLQRLSENKKNIRRFELGLNIHFAEDIEREKEHNCG